MLHTTFSGRLEAFRPDTKPTAIEIQNLGLRTAPVDERVQRAVERIMTHGVSRQGLQTVVGLSRMRCTAFEKKL
jgi:hypothetical protein